MSLMDSIQTTFGVVVLATGISILSLSARPAIAQATGSGTWSANHCGRAEANFIELPGDEAIFGFGSERRGQPSKALLLVRSGDGGRVIGQLAFKYNNPNDKFGRNDFERMLLVFKGVPFFVHFCFKGDHGQGKVFSFDTDMFRMNKKPINGTAWFVVSMEPKDFGDLDVANSVLLSIKFSRETNTNITIGDTNIQLRTGAIRPVEIETQDVPPCDSFKTCPN